MAKTTVDHNEIKTWAEQNGALPQKINYSAVEEEAGIRLHFEGSKDDVYLSDTHPPKGISWSEFFNIFEKKGLEFSYDDEVKRYSPADSYRFAIRGTTLPGEK